MYHAKKTQKKRTTIEFDESVLEQAKEMANEQGATLSEFVQDATLQRIKRIKEPPVELDLPVVPGGRLRPGVDINSNAKLQEILDEGVPLDQLR
jgi:antitoxin component of RelBE/YafQ-DinJ toxin-antitoxin module